MTVAGRSDRGRRRRTNEDAFVIADLGTGARYQGKPATWPLGEAGILCAVSDGMGGAKGGEIASAVTVAGLLERLGRVARERAVDEKALARAVEATSRAVLVEARKRGFAGMGATLTAAVLGRGGHTLLAQVGDSRAYLLRGGELERVTRDQSYVQLLVDAGIMSESEAERSPRKNVVLQAMGQERVRVVVSTVTLTPGDRLLLCSDGLTNVLADATIAKVARLEVDHACEELVRLANLDGGPDNITVVLADIV